MSGTAGAACLPLVCHSLRLQTFLPFLTGIASPPHLCRGPHFADWRALYDSGARSMAAAPMYVQQRVVGVLNLASKDPHAFDRWVGAAAPAEGRRCRRCQLSLPGSAPLQRHVLWGQVGTSFPQAAIQPF